MASKRTATSDLNHDNWNHEDEPEDAGTFATASQEILEKRVVKRAKRRMPAIGEGPSKSAFSGFTGFKTMSTPVSSAFNFLSNTNSKTSLGMTTQTTSTSPTVTPASNGTSKTIENGISSITNISSVTSQSKSTMESTEEAPKDKDNKIFKKSSDYFAKLRGLNESVTQWIKTHVESNPFCILTPIFRDYERYLKEIEAQHGQESSDTSITTEQNNTKTTNITNQTLQSSFASNKSNVENKPTSNNVAPAIKSIFDKSDNIFGDKTKIPENPFLNKSKSEESSNTETNDNKTLETKSLTFPQTSTSNFSFGLTNTNVTSAGFSFGSGKPFTFGANVVVPSNSETKDENADKDEDDEPPKVEFKPITEDGAIYEKRCKVFVKKDGTFGDRGVGVLFLKPTPNGKIQLIVRAENSLGNLLLNTLLTQSIPTKRMNDNTVMLVCLPLADSPPPPTPVLLRVKTKEDADNLLETLDNNKK